MSVNDSSKDHHDTQEYRTLAGKGQGEIKREGSRFLARAYPVTSETQAQQLIDELLRQHHSARHVCYGLRVGLGAQRIDRSNDDGEPARTGGYPIWQLLSGDELENSLIVVIRYYGGTKLGMGGLTRAYRDSARTALEDAGTTICHPETPLQFTVPYARFDEVERLIEDLDPVRITDRSFTDDVQLEVAIWSSKYSQIVRRLGNLLGRSPDELTLHNDTP